MGTQTVECEIVDDDDDDLNLDSAGEEEDDEEDQVAVLTGGLKHLKCSEDDDFMTAFDTMVTENIQVCDCTLQTHLYEVVFR